MKMRGARELRRSNRGSMPFAMVAVALLLVSSTFCVVYANTNDAKENTENITGELTSMDDAIEFAERFIEEGLGKIIYDISADGEGGTLVERASRFGSLKDDWFGSNFPRSENGITIEIIDEGIDMDIQSTKVSSNSVLGERSVASYLRASGNVKATFTGSAGMATKTIAINADGTSGLPFIVDCATRFELSSDGDASLLTQLIVSIVISGTIQDHQRLRAQHGRRRTGHQGHHHCE